MLPHRFPRRGWPLAVPLALVLAATPVSPTSAAPDDPATGAPPAAALPAAGEMLTLVTGDRVQVAPAGNGRVAATVTPAPRSGPEPVFETVTEGEQVYVLPSDAVPLVPDVLDKELFNVTKLAEYGYTNGVPVIVTGAGGAAGTAGTTAADPAGTTAAGTAGMSVGASLSSVDGYAATVAPDGAWWDAARPAATTGDRSAVAAPQTAGGPLAGVEKVWLDQLAEVTLAESVPLVGAPEAWAAGFDGTGVSIGVLDTGIDADHPDLAGKVVAAENFTSEPDASDLNGHGTHVSGIALGTGAASDGARTGVARGADLLMGKVCNASGNCPNSAILAGMEWAAPQADVVSMSLGTFGGSDGTDPLSQAVNTLTAQHDTLFVTSAGNAGFLGDGSVGSPAAADAALAVGSVNKDEELAFTSSRGPRLGDFAIKPGITAPGVDIVSARADGTSLGTPVDDDYTMVSGTSMAAPHVSGAAAILLQQNPNLGPAELKSVLASTAVPSGDLDVYQQGGGRLDVPNALFAPVRATPAPLDLGYFQFPHDGAAPVEADVTYTNRTGAAVTLDLSLAVASRDGAVPSPEMLSVAPGNLTVGPQSTASTTVTLDVSHGEIGLYGGYLVAESAGEVVTRTPVGFFKEGEMYDLSVEGFARDGRPARGSSSVHVINVHDTSEFLETSVTYVDGVATVRVPPGTYHVMGNTFTYDGNNQFFQSWTMVGEPEVEVTDDTTITLDAREANRLEIATPAHEEAAPFGMQRIGFFRAAEETGTFSSSLTGGQSRPIFAMETDPVTLGEFEFYARKRIGDPPLALAIADPDPQDLHPRGMSGSPPIDGAQELPLVWAGFGEPADYEGLDAEGAAVLTMRGGPGHAAKEATARANGAAALLVMNNATGNYSGGVGSAAEIPTMTVPGEEGELLRGLLDDGGVTLRLSGTSVTPFLYDVLFHEPDRIPGELHYVADPDELATLDNAFHSGVPDQSMGEARHSWRPWESVSIGIIADLPAPQERTAFLTAGDTRYRQRIDAQQVFVGTMNEGITSYQPGEHRDQSWFQSPLHPGIVEGGPLQTDIPVVREGDTLDVLIPAWVDTNPSHWGFVDGAVDTSAFRLFQDGELVAEASRASGDFALSPDPATYRLELDATRTADWWPTSTATRTAWTVRSGGTTQGPEEVPLLLVDYDADLDLTNTADRKLLPTVDLRVRHQPGADGPRIHRPTVSISYDDGQSWHRGFVLPRGRDRYTALFLQPLFPPRDAEFASLRVEARDKDGNRIEQEITRAWQLPAR